MKRAILLGLLLFAGSARSAGSPEPERLPAEGDLPAALLLSPEAGGAAPLLVALHAEGERPEDVTERLVGFAVAAGFRLLAPASRGLSFAAEEIEGVAARAEAVRDRAGGGPVFLLGFDDAAVAAVRFAFARPRLFRAVVAVGADAPEVRERAPGVLLLVMKASDDRPIAARESAERLAERLEAVDFRALPPGGALDPPALSHLRWFLGIADGRAAAGAFPGFAWRPPARAAAERKATGRGSLVYLFDGEEAHRERTLEIEGRVLLDPALRRAVEASVPVLAPRADAEKLFPDLRLAPGPALVVTGPEGDVRLVEQRKITAKSLAGALERR